MSVPPRVRDLVLSLLADRDLDLYDIEMQSGVLRVVVDRDTGLNLDDLAGLSRALSRALDDDDPIAGRYTLEVTSPGVERVLRTPEHFRGAVGETVKVRTAPGVADERRVEGTLVAADRDGITVRTSADEGGRPVERRLAHVDIERARTVFEWGPATGKGRAGGKAARRGAAGSNEERERTR